MVHSFLSEQLKTERPDNRRQHDGEEVLLSLPPNIKVSGCGGTYTVLRVLSVEDEPHHTTVPWSHQC